MESERLFTIIEGLRVIVRENKERTYLIIESDGSAIYLNADKWKKFKKYFPIINTEFQLRLDKNESK